MTKGDNGGPMVDLTIELSKKQVRYLERLQTTGLYGRSIVGVARVLILDGIKQACADKLLDIDRANERP